MSRRQFLAGTVVTGAGLAGLSGFAVAAEPVAGEIVVTSTQGLSVWAGEIAAGDVMLPVYGARPEEAGRYPVVLVVPEIFGMHEYIKDVVRRFAHEGMFAITFEPYAREGGVVRIADRAQLMRLVNAVPDSRVMADMNALVGYVKQHAAARSDRIGVTGFCRGGLYAMLFGGYNPDDVKALVSWYGQIKPPLTPGIRSVGPLQVVPRITAPLLGLYGEEDMGIPVADVRELEAAFVSAGKHAEFILYPGAPHAFHADYRPSYRAEAARDAWSRSVTFLRNHLGNRDTAF